MGNNPGLDHLPPRPGIKFQRGGPPSYQATLDGHTPLSLSPTARRRQQRPGSANKSGRDLKRAAISKGTFPKGRWRGGL